MLTFQGEKDFGQPPAQVWARMSDARFLVECIPGGENITVAEPDKAVCTQRPGFAFIRGKLELTILITERIPDQALTLALHSKGIGTSSEVEAKLQFAATETGTHLTYQAEVKTLGGLLKAVPSGLIRGAASKIISDTWEEVGKKLEA